jgi:hypothetical protein
MRVSNTVLTDTSDGLFGGEEATARLDAARIYRYSLTRRWGHGRPLVWVGLNPSTAGADTEDPTTRRIRGFTAAAGHRAYTLINLFALRATDPGVLATHHDPVGPATDDEICRALTDSVAVVAAWGAADAARDRVGVVRDLLAAAGAPVLCLGMTKAGHPRHPLYVPGGTPLVGWPS